MSRKPLSWTNGSVLLLSLLTASIDAYATDAIKSAVLQRCSKLKPQFLDLSVTGNTTTQSSPPCVICHGGSDDAANNRAQALNGNYDSFCAPIITLAVNPPGPVTIKEQQSGAVNAVVSVNNTDPIVVSVSPDPAPNGSFNADNNTLTYIAPIGSAGTSKVFTFTASDLTSYNVVPKTATVTFNVLGPNSANDPPQFKDTTNAWVIDPTQFTPDFLVRASDAEGKAISFTIDSVPDGIEFTDIHEQDADGRWVGQFSVGTPPPAPGAHLVKVTATDQAGAKAYATYVIRIEETLPRAGRKIDLISANFINGAAAHQSTVPDISADGRYVAFASRGKNLLLVPETTTSNDIFLRDRVTKKTQLISQSSYGERDQASDSTNPSISADGQVIAFESKAALDGTDKDTTSDIYVRVLADPPQTELASIDPGGAKIGGTLPALSANGRYVAFLSGSSPNIRVYVRDLQLNTTELVSVNTAGVASNDVCDTPSISSDGRFVAFQSAASNLVPTEDPDAIKDVFVRDRLNKTTFLVSKSSDQVKGIASSLDPDISDVQANGSVYVAYTSFAPNLIQTDKNNKSDVFLTKLDPDGTATTRRVSCNLKCDDASEHSSSPDITPDGRFVVYQSLANDIVPEPKLRGLPNNTADIFLWDRDGGKTRLLSLDAYGRSAIKINAAHQIFFAQSLTPTVSDDGQVVAFFSDAMNLISPSAPKGGDDILTYSLKSYRDQVDLSVSLEASANPVAVGGNLVLTATVTNYGPKSAESVSLLVITGSFKATSITPSRGTCSDTPPTICGFGDMASGQAVTVIFQGVAPAKAAVPFSATVSAVGRDPIPANNLARVTVKVTPAP